MSSEFGYGRLNVYRAVLKVYGAPVIFTAPKVIELPLGAPSPELLKGVTADDFVDGDLTASVLASGAVDTRKPGEYTVSYSVTDSHGNRAMPVRRVYRVFPAGASDANGNVSPEVLAPFF